MSRCQKSTSRRVEEIRKTFNQERHLEHGKAASPDYKVELGLL